MSTQTTAPPTKKLVPAKPMTFRQLKEKIETFTEEQLDMPVRWWGEERGGMINALDVLPEDYMQDEEGLVERSAFDEETIESLGLEVGVAKGTPVFGTDLYAHES
jgi:hypothetical protein